MEAAEHNSKILADHDYDLEKAYSSQGFSELSMGSELRPVNQLEPLIHHHPNKSAILKIATLGVDYPISDLDEESRKELVNKKLQKGNHKSALTKEAIPIVNKLMEKDVINAFSIIVTLDCLRKLKDCEVYPMGLQNQTTVDEKGKVIPKKRLTHDLSDERKEGKSINQRVKTEDLPDCMYGHALSRFLHLIHHIRFHSPGKRILANKIDIDAAYRRLTTTPKISAKCSAQWFIPEEDSQGSPLLKEENKVGTILNRLPFGSSPAPAFFSQFSEFTFDLAEELIHLENWDPNSLSPPLHDLLPEPERLDDSIPFGEALETDVSFPTTKTGGSDGYIDDGANAVLDTPENEKQVNRTKNANLMSLFITFRPHMGDKEPVPRSQVASVRKLLAEGTLREVITFLGWLINTREFKICLPTEKASGWIHTIASLLNKDIATFKELETLVGRLDHVCFIIPSARHFMNRLRRLKMKANKQKKAKLTKEVIKDLRLWIEFLTKAKNGISINEVVFRKPTCTAISDSSEIGIGGYSFNSNILWRYQFTIEEQKAFSLNLKEYIAATIGALLAVQNDDSPHPCILSLSDSSSTVSWLHKSNHDPTSSPCHNEVARWHARNLMQNKAIDYSQHIKGSENHIADSLSRDFHLTEDKLLSLFKTVCPHLLPPNAQVVQLPPHLISKIASLAQLQPNPRELNWQPKQSTIAHGVTGWNFYDDHRLPTPIWTSTPPSIGPVSYAPSWMNVETDHSQNKIPLRETPRKRPLTTWLRPSSQVVGQTQEQTNQENATSCSNVN
jgi:hypothetical protein